MTETQSPENHRRPLAPGEIRRHTVGAQTFQVMHVAGGSFTQAGVRYPATTCVLATEPFESDAVRVYADAIEQAESDAIDAIEGDDASQFLGADGDLIIPGLSSTPQDRSADGVPEVAQQREELRRTWPERLAQASAPAPTHADDVAALRSILARQPHGPHRSGILERLDRIAARAPQRATDHIVDVPARDMDGLRRWLERPNGSWGPAGSRVSMDAVEGGGIMIRTRPYTFGGV